MWHHSSVCERSGRSGALSALRSPRSAAHAMTSLCSRCFRLRGVLLPHRVAGTLPHAVHGQRRRPVLPSLHQRRGHPHLGALSPQDRRWRHSDGQVPPSDVDSISSYSLHGSVLRVVKNPNQRSQVSLTYMKHRCNIALTLYKISWF